MPLRGGTSERLRGSAGGRGGAGRGRRMAAGDHHGVDMGASRRRGQLARDPCQRRPGEGIVDSGSDGAISRRMPPGRPSPHCAPPSPVFFTGRPLPWGGSAGDDAGLSAGSPVISSALRPAPVPPWLFSRDRREHAGGKPVLSRPCSWYAPVQLLPPTSATPDTGSASRCC